MILLLQEHYPVWCGFDSEARIGWEIGCLDTTSSYSQSSSIARSRSCGYGSLLRKDIRRRWRTPYHQYFYYQSVQQKHQRHESNNVLLKKLFEPIKNDNLFHRSHWLNFTSSLFLRANAKCRSIAWKLIPAFPLHPEGPLIRWVTSSFALNLQ